MFASVLHACLKHLQNFRDKCKSQISYFCISFQFPFCWKNVHSFTAGFRLVHPSMVIIFFVMYLVTLF